MCVCFNVWFDCKVLLVISMKGGQASRSAVVAEILAKHLGDYE
jgi:hypothetical protein